MTMSNHKRRNALLWTLQVLLAVLFLFAGTMKLVSPIDEMARMSGLPGGFLLFIGAAELAGGLGLVLPGLLRVRRALTPLAAAGLVLVMVGAVVVSALRMGVASAAVPLVVSALLVLVVRGRLDWARRPAPPVVAREHGAIAS